MTYRDDHEAALRRAAALEVELEAARADAATAREALDASEAERTRLAAALARTATEARSTPADAPDAPPPRPWTRLDLIAQAMVVTLLALCLIVVVVMLTL